jgi:hypothetical protein
MYHRKLGNVDDSHDFWVGVPGESVCEVFMNDSIAEMQQLLKEVIGQLQAGTIADKRKAVAKLERIISLASTMALTLKAQR